MNVLTVCKLYCVFIKSNATCKQQAERRDETCKAWWTKIQINLFLSKHYKYARTCPMDRRC